MAREKTKNPEVDMNDFIHKKNAVLEVIKHIDKAKNIGIAGVAGIFITLIVNTINRDISFVVAAAASLLIIYLIYTEVKEKKRLGQTYLE